MYFNKKKKTLPRSDLRTRLEEYTAWKDKESWFIDEEKGKKNGSRTGVFPIKVLRDIHSFLLIKIIAVCLIILFVFLFTFIQMPFSTGLLEKIYFVTTWDMDFIGIGRRALPVISRMWEGDLENLGQEVMAPKGVIHQNEETGEDKLIFSPPIEGEVGRSFGIEPHPFLERDEMSYGMIFRPSREMYVRASAAGVVKEVNEHPYYGLFLSMRHALEMETYYGYLAEVFVEEGELIEQGQNIALVGFVPGENEKALYFEMREKGRPLDPLPLLAGSRN